MYRKTLIFVFWVYATQLFATDADCVQIAQTQLEMNNCAAQAYQAADEDLNVAYQLAQASMKRQDVFIAEGAGQDLPDDYISGVILLRDAQRAWIVFRDKSCAAEGHSYYGGSIRPLIEATCKETLTRARTEQLRAAFEEN